MNRVSKDRKGFSGRRTIGVLFLFYVLAGGVCSLRAGVVGLSAPLTRQSTEPRVYIDSLGTEYQSKPLLQDARPLIGRKSYIDIYGFFARLLGQRQIRGVVRMDNGQLIDLYKLAKESKVDRAAQSITSLYAHQRDAGKAFLLVMTPSKVPPDEQIIPLDYADFSNANADALLARLRESGVPFLDLRQSMREDDYRYEDAFFVTDHHWNTEACFWAWGKIQAELLQSGAIPPVAPLYTDISNYNIDVFKDVLLGSAGAKTGSYYAGRDDMAVITPKFETRFTAECFGPEMHQEGTFSQVFVDLPLLQKFNYYAMNKDYLYNAFCFGDLSRHSVSNALAPLDQKLLWICDSYGNAVVPFGALLFRETEDLDMRYYEVDFAKFFAEYQPDVTVLLIGATHATDGNATYEYFPEATAP